MATPREIHERLKEIPYPGYTRDIVSFGIVEDVEVAGTGVTITLSLAGRDEEVIERVRKDITRLLESMEIGPPEFRIVEPPKGGLGSAKPKPKGGNIRRIIAVASGKGGVGKSTVAVNLALAFRRLGRSVGLLDADVYGPSVPGMLGVTGRPGADEQKRIEPLEAHGIRVISMGFFLDAGKAVVWRGPMITKLLTEFFQNVLWGDLDVLILDLPPGTGDAQLTICQNVPLSGGVIVTTPQEVALLDVQRGVRMFREAGVPVLGVVENMNRHTCRKCGHEAALFSQGGGERMAHDLGVPLLASLPIVPELRIGGDSGRPLLTEFPDHPAARSFVEMAEQVERGLDDQTASPSLPILS